MSTQPKRFSIRGFLLQVGIQQTVLYGAIAFLWPNFWEQQVAARFGAFILSFLVIHLGLCFFEWGFHRYVLHGTIHPLLGRFSHGHRDHHFRTPIRLERVPDQPDQVVLNRYPITSVEQYENSAFPVYALAVFWVFFTPLLLITQWLLPSAPIILAGYAAITWSMVCYEVFHAIEHYRYEWWERAITDRLLGRMWTSIYGFHHYHHANIAWNEAISGFFGLPVADWVFRTYWQPRELLLSGRVATIRDFHPYQKPWRFIRALDRWAAKRESAHRHRPPR